MADDWVQNFKPDGDELIDLLRPQIDDDMLREIADADYAQDGELHLIPLKQFRDEWVIPVLDWHPAEVLELIRWSEPDDPEWKPGSPGRRGHLLRAFACAMLLRSYPHPPNETRWHSLKETAIQLADSLEALDGPLVPAGQRFLAWCIQKLGAIDQDGTERPFLGLALLSLAGRDRGVCDASIVSLCEWIAEEVSALPKEQQRRATHERNWLLSTNFHNLKNSRWIGLGQSLYQWAENQPDSERATWVALIGHSLAED